MDTPSIVFLSGKENTHLLYGKSLCKALICKVKKIATCPYCDIVLSAGKNSGTSHLKRHLDRCPNRDSSLVGADNVDTDFVFDIKELRKYIMYHIVEGGHPFTMVEENGFRRMMLKANPGFIPFSRTTTTRDLLEYYVYERERLKNMVVKSPGRICFTTDNWSCKHTWQHYICVTAHFVDSNWKLNKRILRFRALTPPYDGESIANEMFMFLSQWQIEHKVLTVSVDNAKYNDLMIAKLRGLICSKGGTLVGGGKLFQIRCCAHIINLIVQDGLSCISNILENIRNLVKFITKSTRRAKDFYEAAEKSFHLNVKRKLSLDMAVRWNSTYHMLENVFYFKEALMSLGSLTSHFKGLLPSEEEWLKLSVIHKFLKVFYEVTCMFSVVKQPTSNVYLKGACMVRHRLVEASKSQHTFLAEMVKPMVKKCEKYWSEYNIYLSCATILDPRFKVKYVEYCFTKLFGAHEAALRVDNVLSILNSLYDDYKGKSASLVVSPPPPSSTGHGLEDDSFFDDYNNFRGRNVTTLTKKSQLELYLEEEAFDKNAELDVLQFWRLNSVKFPELSALARDLLTIPVSTVPSESAFSLGGKTVSPSRSSLKPKTVQALVCAQDWRRALDETPLQLDDECDDEMEHEDEDDHDDIDLVL